MAQFQAEGAQCRKESRCGPVMRATQQQTDCEWRLITRPVRRPLRRSDPRPTLGTHTAMVAAEIDGYKIVATATIYRMQQKSDPSHPSSPNVVTPSGNAWAAIKARICTRDMAAGVVMSAAPTMVFVVANAAASLTIAIMAAAVTATAALAYRGARREPLTGALVGAAIVLACAAVAALTREARGFFLLPTAVPFLIITVCLVSVAVRRPLSGLLLNRVVGGPPDWRRRAELRGVYTVSTMTFVAVNATNAALQVPLYLYGKTSILAISHVVTQPVFVVIVAATLVFARRTVVRAGEPDQGVDR
jgi:hypothetical protein